MEIFQVQTTRFNQLLDITAEVQKIVSRNHVKTGLAVVFCPHTTAAVTINENCDPSVADDIIDTLARLIPRPAGYHHTEGNADAHIKAALIGSSQTVFIENGKLRLGTWQGVFFCEFDGPRTREIWIKILQDKN